MAERFKAPVLKTGEGQPSVGSNPTLSATFWQEFPGMRATFRLTHNGRAQADRVG